MSRKSERLVNLTIALLATKRPISKSEIFSRVAGYEGSPEAMERMFERDKEQLRSIGVPLQTKVIDSYFDDELGYLIDSSQYSIDLGQVDSHDVALMAMAIKILEGDNNELLLRIRSLHQEDESLPLASLPIVASAQIAELVSAIENRSFVSFEYADNENHIRLRTVAPYHLYSERGDWYLLSKDSDKDDYRNFKLSRIRSDIRLTGKTGYDIPADYLTLIERRPQKETTLLLRKGQALRLRSFAHTIKEEDDWDRATITYIDEEWLLQEILWHLESVMVQEPVELRNLVISSLEKVVREHE